ncbi:4-alpha-glucanotransferase [Actinocatenispora thailandica]|uniref:4-alpha-glucanotransferase n=1 Tax=Actinocatenispora thailandica TaxID=227318 RepID=A0A7R7HXR3_9ACTN|nr:4-alpha-glucanotransferase [Actinocatenispora thailandica]BCJ36213.1 4-alpha-glucanotransferase [Actinocatenispora thailandica]
MDAELAELAHAAGVATEYRDDADRPVAVDPAVVVAVLAELGLDAATPRAIQAARTELAGRQAAPVPATLTVAAGTAYPVPDGALTAQDGTRRRITDALPASLPPGWYTLHHAGRDSTVLVTPRTLPPVPACWGLTVQPYALHSARSWGIGEYADLRELVAASRAQLCADVLVAGPLCAPRLVPPVQPSPYSPASRRFANPLYLRIDELPEYAAADEATRRRVDALRPAPAPLIDHDAVWAAKQAALALLWRYRLPTAPPDPALARYATWCALAERHGADWRRWPPQLRRPDDPAVRRAAADLADRVGFHAWVQRRCADQLAGVDAAGSTMAIGVLHDLPVGVDPAGADAWAFQDVLAGGASVGAPPDAFSTAGQDWGFPPWRPDRLAEVGYLPYRQMLDALLGHGGGLRVDHVAGLFRLWWIPRGGSPADGTYVRYDAPAMLGALTLAAYQANAVVVGEDLGTVEPAVTAALAQRGMLGCEVLWFARDAAGRPLPPEAWPERAMASISTHDLPTAAGFLTGEAIGVRDRLGLLADPTAARHAAAAERHELLAQLARRGLLAPHADLDGTVLAMHALLHRTPCRIKAVAPTDVLGELRAPNLPGTTDQYPNWRIPLPATVPELVDDLRLRRIAALLRPPTTTPLPDDEPAPDATAASPGPERDQGNRSRED